jgi:hypothetical protein
MIVFNTIAKPAAVLVRLEQIFDRRIRLHQRRIPQPQVKAREQLPHHEQ